MNLILRVYRRWLRVSEAEKWSFGRHMELGEQKMAGEGKSKFHTLRGPCLKKSVPHNWLLAHLTTLWNWLNFSFKLSQALVDWRLLVYSVIHLLSKVKQTQIISTVFGNQYLSLPKIHETYRNWKQTCKCFRWWCN